MLDRRALPALAIVAVVGLASCGSGDDDLADVVAVPGEDGDDQANDDESGSAAADPSDVSGGIMLAAELDPGVIEVEVDGQTFEFRRDDPEQMDFECEVDQQRVELGFQSSSNDHAMSLEYARLPGADAPGEPFFGSATIDPRTLPEGFYATNQSKLEESFVDRDSPYVFIVVDAAFAESRSDVSVDSVGTMIIRANCEDGGGDGEASAGGDSSGVVPTADAGTPDRDGHAATFELLSEPVSYDFGAIMDDVTCASSGGFATAAGEIEAGSGQLAFESIVYDPAEVGEQLDLPYVLVEDDEAGVAYVAGPVPGRDSIDPGGSAVYQVVFTGDGFEVSGGFIEVGGDPLALIPGTLRVSCP